MSLFDVRLLQKLLNPDEGRGSDSDTDDDEKGGQKRTGLNPAHIGPPKAAAKPNASTKLATEAPKEKPISSIEEWQALQEAEDRELLETRPRPEYRMTYRQAVGTEDVFLQMGNRSNASASCEDLLIEIDLPDETIDADKMDLDITESEVDLATPVYRLRLPLPHKVDVDRCQAKYDSQARRLTLTLRLKRELDFVNF